eukprot:TRINITY_DN872_c0_g1_i1.p1 TRINITY_DN872_c0_g1~~TRINITY_DN872_c0_g1_i1.p1  ORF type:complete len:131 (+),score=2.32 TRINITY_DN872_c0_g1_i1:51-443(+)
MHSVYSKMAKDTKVVIETSAGDSCSGSWHTSCSRDIVGWTAGTDDLCNDVVISGWSSVKNGECDDGYSRCGCDVCDNHDESECMADSLCTYDELKKVCTLKGYKFYTRGSGNMKNAMLAAVLSVAAFIAF